MKTMKGKLLKKIKTIKSIGYLKPERVLHVNAADVLIDLSPTKPSVSVQTGTEGEAKVVKQSKLEGEEPEIIDVSELMRDLEDDEVDSDDGIDDKENIQPERVVKNPDVSARLSNSLTRGIGKSERVCRNAPLGETDVSNFRRPDLDSGSLFDPNLLAAFEQAVMEVKAKEAETRARIEELNHEITEEEEGEAEPEPPLKSRKIEENRDPLLDFEEKCPPGGADSVIFYTTGLRGIRKTFEDCNSIRFLLESFRILFFERDLSMHSEFREELWSILGGKVVPPRLFIRGRYIGGAEQVLRLHEQGKLRPLFEGVPVDRSAGPCEGCAGVRFVMCFNCSGSHKVVSGESLETCPECNENGLIICPLCC